MAITEPQRLDRVLGRCRQCDLRNGLRMAYHDGIDRLFNVATICHDE
jgi:hypothetical protein